MPLTSWKRKPKPLFRDLHQIYCYLQPQRSISICSPTRARQYQCLQDQKDGRNLNKKNQAYIVEVVCFAWSSSFHLTRAAVPCDHAVASVRVASDSTPFLTPTSVSPPPQNQKPKLNPNPNQSTGSLPHSTPPLPASEEFPGQPNPESIASACESGKRSISSAPARSAPRFVRCPSVPPTSSRGRQLGDAAIDARVRNRALSLAIAHRGWAAGCCLNRPRVVGVESER